MKDARLRAARKGIACTITPEEIHARIARGACEMTGLAFSMNPTGMVRVDPFSPSLDRLDPRRGYTPKNVRVVVAAFNFAKGEWPLDTFGAIARGFIERNRA